MPRLSGRELAWQRWQAAAGPWRGWVICPSLMLPTDQLDRHAAMLDRHVAILDRHAAILDRHTAELHRHTAELDRHASELRRHTAEVDRHTAALDRHTDELALSLRIGGVAMVLDLEPCLGVSLAAALNGVGLGHAALVLPRWPHQDAILPTAQLVRTLIEASQHLSTTGQRSASDRHTDQSAGHRSGIGPSHGRTGPSHGQIGPSHGQIGPSRRDAGPSREVANVIFVLDGERKRSLPRRPLNDRRVDNRYDLAVADLPTLAALRRRGIARVIRVTHRG